MDEIRTQWYLYPSLKRSENDLLFLLVWSSAVHSYPHRSFSEWAVSTKGLESYQRLIRGFQCAQPGEQLALTLGALLAFLRLLPYSPNDSSKPIRGCYLADFDSLISGEQLGSERVVLEHMLCHLRQTLCVKGAYLAISQLLDRMLDASMNLDECAQYTVLRVDHGMSHQNALRYMVRAASKPSWRALVLAGSTTARYDIIDRSSLIHH